MDKCQREKNSLYCMKKEEIMTDGRNYFQQIDNEAESYFILREESEYCMEYNFELLSELKSLMDKLCVYGQDIEKVLLVASLKNKPQEPDKNSLRIQQSKNVEDDQNSNELPMFIYNF